MPLNLQQALSGPLPQPNNALAPLGPPRVGAGASPLQLGPMIAQNDQQPVGPGGVPLNPQGINGLQQGMQGQQGSNLIRALSSLLGGSSGSAQAPASEPDPKR